MTMTPRYLGVGNVSVLCSIGYFLCVRFMSLPYSWCVRIWTLGFVECHENGPTSSQFSKVMAYVRTKSMVSKSAESKSTWTWHLPHWVPVWVTLLRSPMGKKAKTDFPPHFHVVSRCRRLQVSFCTNFGRWNQNLWKIAFQDWRYYSFNSAKKSIHLLLLKFILNH